MSEIAKNIPEPKPKHVEKDHFLELIKSLIEYLKADQMLTSTNRTFCELDQGNQTGSCIWIRLPIQDEYPEMVPNMISSGVEERPDMCLAGVLLTILKNRFPEGVNLTGMSIDNHEKSLHFCISGSTSLEELRSLYEQYQQTSGFEG